MEREEDNKEEITWKEVTSEASLPSLSLSGI
jgi:hypothetical protein